MPLEWFSLLEDGLLIYLKNKIMFKILRTSTYKNLINLKYTNEISEIFKYLKDNFQNYSFHLSTSAGYSDYVSITVNHNGVRLSIDKITDLESLKLKINQLMK
jgi:hypothetical protein